MDLTHTVIKVCSIFFGGLLEWTPPNQAPQNQGVTSMNWTPFFCLKCHISVISESIAFIMSFSFLVYIHLLPFIPPHPDKVGQSITKLSTSGDGKGDGKGGTKGGDRKDERRRSSGTSRYIVYRTLYKWSMYLEFYGGNQDTSLIRRLSSIPWMYMRSLLIRTLSSILWTSR